MALADQVTLFRRWVGILKRDGLIPFVKQWFLFAIRCFVCYQTSYTYRIELGEELDEVDFTLKKEDASLKVVSSNMQVNELVADGFDFDYFVVKADRRLDRGAIAVCAFVEHKLTHISWVALTRAAEDTLTSVPYPVDFSREAYSGGTVKNIKYQRLASFSTRPILLKAMQVARQGGKKFFWFVVVKGNRIARNALAKRISALPYGEGRYLKLLRWKSWKEKPTGRVGASRIVFH